MYINMGEKKFSLLAIENFQNHLFKKNNIIFWQNFSPQKRLKRTPQFASLGIHMEVGSLKIEYNLHHAIFMFHGFTTHKQLYGLI